MIPEDLPLKVTSLSIFYIFSQSVGSAMVSCLAGLSLSLLYCIHSLRAVAVESGVAAGCILYKYTVLEWPGTGCSL